VASGSVIARILTQYSDKGSKAAQRDINKLGKQFGDFGRRAAKAFAVAGVAAAAFAVKIGKDAVQAAMADQKSQLLLANALRNTVGATDENIAATEAYISAMQRQFAIADDDLRPSLAALAAVTGDLAEAQALQNIAVDVAAGTGKDLASVTQAIVKAYQGNLGALRRLGVPLEDNVVKSKDFNKAMQALSETFAGAGTTSANTFAGKLRNLQLTYSDIIEQLGYALIPVLEKLASFITTTILPALEQWITTNKDQVASSLQSIIDGSIKAGKALFKFFKVIKDNFQAVKNLGAILTGLFVAGKVYAGIVAITTAINLLKVAFAKQAVVAGTAAVATAAATGGANLVAAGIALTAFAATTGVALVALNGTGEATEKTAQSAANLREHMARVEGVTKKTAKTTKTVFDNTNKTVTAAKKLTAEENKQLQIKEALRKSGLGALGIQNLSTVDPISLEAARLNLLKENNIQEMNRLAAIQKFHEWQKEVNLLSARYADILSVINDRQVSPQEVALLAKKWNESEEAVLKYLAYVTNAPLPEGWDDAGKIAQQGWNDALAALNKYYSALGEVPPVKLPNGTTITPPSVTSPKIQEPTVVIPQAIPVIPNLGTSVGTGGVGSAQNPILDPWWQEQNRFMDFSYLDDLFRRDQTSGQLTINVTGTGGLSDETKKEVVNAVVEASGQGYSTNWFRTTGGGEGIFFT
jgi:hypothetical protein